jgi:hypothetical protein
MIAWETTGFISTARSSNGRSEDLLASQRQRTRQEISLDPREPFWSNKDYQLSNGGSPAAAYSWRQVDTVDAPLIILSHRHKQLSPKRIVAPRQSRFRLGPDLRS